ncbi:MAG: winged helix-turn-helix transcriptional regulator [Deltaproteobacteria bacterium]|nr:winged helix-turn-helix transcriptional regulator [Deltaproteobacteria bacterium]
MGRKKVGLRDDALQAAAECLRVVAHPHRLKILQLLLADSYAVGELAKTCGIASAVCSEHLRTMQRCGFLTAERRGRHTYYRVKEPHVEDLLRCMESRFGE